jgi:2-methylisocitrate lyase-like PEP mutase family enzyme
MYMTGYGTSLSKPGYPDAGLTTMFEIIDNANNIQERVDAPVIADADTGYGNATNVVRTVREYIKTDIGGIHIENQTIPKRCSHVKGRQLIPQEEAVGKIRAAADVRDERDETFVLIARTDARGAVDGSLAEAIDRVSTYCDAGADVAFVEGWSTKLRSNGSVRRLTYLSFTTVSGPPVPHSPSIQKCFRQ